MSVNPSLNSMNMNSIESILEYYIRVRKRTLRLIDSIEPHHLSYTYKEGKFTIADQIRHIAAIERYLYAETIQGGKNKYRGCGSDLADGYEAILLFFNRTHAESMEIFERINEQDLQNDCLTPTGHSIKKGRWLQLLAEHEIHHRSQIYLSLNLFGVETPPIFGLTAEQVADL